MGGRSRRTFGGAAALLLVLAGVGCSDDDSDDAVDTEESTVTEAPDAAGTVEEGAEGEDEGDPAGDTGDAEVIEVIARDYEFEGLPDTIAAGSTLSLTSEAGGEPHEIVVFARPDGETRTVEELTQLSEEEASTVFAAEPALVAIAVPGETDTLLAVGDGTIAEPGEYLYFCTFPQGTTTEQVVNATGPIEGEGPPHLVLGMAGEFTAE